MIVNSMEIEAHPQIEVLPPIYSRYPSIAQSPSSPPLGMPEGSYELREVAFNPRRAVYPQIDQPLPPAPPALSTLLMLALCIASFVIALDGSMIATAIPSITNSFQNTQAIGWIASAYLLTFCAFRPFFAKLYLYCHIKSVLTAAFIIFEVGSVVSWSAGNSMVLIIGRAITGLGSAGIFTGALIIVCHLRPADTHPLSLAFLGFWNILGVVFGPLIGGAFTSTVTWRWCFFANVPLAVGVSAIILLFLPEYQAQEDDQHQRGVRNWTIWKLDPFGLPAFISSMVCLLLALGGGGITRPWDANGTNSIFLFWSAAVMLVFFVGQWLQSCSSLVQEHRWVDMATIPLDIAFRRTIAFGSLFTFLQTGAFFIVTYFLPVWFQAIKGKTALQSGIDILPLALAINISLVFSGFITTISGLYMPSVYASIVLTSIGAVLLTTLTPDTSTTSWVCYQIIFGLGCGLGYPLPLLAVKAVLAPKDVFRGILILSFAQNLSGAIFVSVGSCILDSKLLNYIGALPKIDPKAVIQLGSASNLRPLLISSFNEDSVESIIQAYNHALVNTLQVAMLVSFLSILGAVGMEWKTITVVEVEKQQPAGVRAEEA